MLGQCKQRHYQGEYDTQKAYDPSVELRPREPSGRTRMKSQVAEFPLCSALGDLVDLLGIYLSGHKLEGSSLQTGRESSPETDHTSTLTQTSKVKYKSLSCV